MTACVEYEYMCFRANCMWLRNKISQPNVDRKIKHAMNFVSCTLPYLISYDYDGK